LLQATGRAFCFPEFQQASAGNNACIIQFYVLDDENKTAVIHQRGMGAALGFSQKSGGRLPQFITGKNISPYIGRELRQKLENPIVFQGLDTVSGNPSGLVLHGFDVTLLIDVCKAIVAAEAEGKLVHHQKRIANQAHVILNASAKAGIKGLVYALAGYDASKEEAIAAFKLYVRQEAREYEKGISAPIVRAMVSPLWTTKTREKSSVEVQTPNR